MYSEAKRFTNVACNEFQVTGGFKFEIKELVREVETLK